MTGRAFAPLLTCATLLFGARGIAQDVSTPPSPAAGEMGNPNVASPKTAEAILANQPTELVSRLLKKKVVVLREIQEKGSPPGGVISSYVLFEKPIERVYRLLAQSARQVEFRPELMSIETVEIGRHGPIDEHRLTILFQRYVYRIEYRLSPELRRIDWSLDARFDNDFDLLVGSWELFPMHDDSTLGLSGISIDVGPAIPRFLQDWVTRKNIPEAMKRVRSWVNSDGGYRP